MSWQVTVRNEPKPSSRVSFFFWGKAPGGRLKGHVSNRQLMHAVSTPYIDLADTISS